MLYKVSTPTHTSHKARSPWLSLSLPQTHVSPPPLSLSLCHQARHAWMEARRAEGRQTAMEMYQEEVDRENGTERA